MSRYLNRQGIPVDIAEWAKALDTDKVVKQETVAGKWVSTVWLGADHGFGGTPKYFETMVFPAKADCSGPVSWTEEDCRRYTTEAEAVAGHAEVVARLRGAS